MSFPPSDSRLRADQYRQRSCVRSSGDSHSIPDSTASHLASPIALRNQMTVRSSSRKAATCAPTQSDGAGERSANKLCRTMADATFRK